MSDKTLADYLRRPHTSLVQFGDVTVPAIIEQYKAYVPKAGNMPNPEEEAIQFYLLNGAAALIRQKMDKNQVLDFNQELVLSDYYETMKNIGHRAFFYLLLICTRESRHVLTTESMTNACKPLGALPFWKTLRVLESEEAVEQLLNNPPNISLKNYTEHLVLAFNEGGKKSGGYAGPKWAAVAKPLRDFVHGMISMEVLLDTVWTLAHNNGPIFNKGMLFKNYHGEGLQKILDVQRAGQIANLVAFVESSHVTNKHKLFLQRCQQAVANFGNTAVDWQQVNDLGAKTQYKVKTTQKPIAYAPPPPPLATVQITPTDFVQKITRAQAKK